MKYILFIAMFFIGQANANLLEETLDQHNDMIEIEDVTYFGLSFLAITGKENRFNSGEKKQAERANKMCMAMGYSGPSFSLVEWRRDTENVLVVDPNGNIVQTQVEPHYYDLTRYNFAVFKRLKCHKL